MSEPKIEILDDKGKAKAAKTISKKDLEKMMAMIASTKNALVKHAPSQAVVPKAAPKPVAKAVPKAPPKTLTKATPKTEPKKTEPKASSKEKKYTITVTIN